MTNLKNARIAYGLTQKELSDRSGVNIRLLQDYEQGHKPINNAKAISVYKLSEALHCNVWELLELDEE